MVNNKHITVAVCMVLNIGVLICSPVTADNENNGTDDRILKLDAKIKNGLTKEYYTDARCLVNGITSGHNGDCLFASQLLNSMLQKELTSDNSDNDDIVIMTKLTMYLISLPTNDSTQMKINGLLAARFLGKIRREITPNFIRLPVTLNVPIPFGVKGYSGMDPKEITDKKERVKYEKTIKENQTNNWINMRQEKLQHIDNQISGRIIRYLAKSMRAQAADKEYINNCIINARLNDIERKRILAEENNKKQ
jgi:hypothetical protein